MCETCGCTITPANAHLYRVLGWEEPIWVHLPLILNQRREKLAKRDPEGGYLLRDFQEGFAAVSGFPFMNKKSIFGKAAGIDDQCVGHGPSSSAGCYIRGLTPDVTQWVRR